MPGGCGTPLPPVPPGAAILAGQCLEQCSVTPAGSIPATLGTHGPSRICRPGRPRASEGARRTPSAADVITPEGDSEPGSIVKARRSPQWPRQASLGGGTPALSVGVAKNDQNEGPTRRSAPASRSSRLSPEILLTC